MKAAPLQPSYHLAHAASNKDKFMNKMRIMFGSAKSQHAESAEQTTNNFLNVNNAEAIEAADPNLESPEYALKIYKSDQSYRYLLIHRVSY